MAFNRRGAPVRLRRKMRGRIGILGCESPGEGEPVPPAYPLVKLVTKED